MTDPEHADEARDATGPPSAAALREAFASCDRWIGWHGSRTADRYLAGIGAGVQIDTYGDEGVVAELESELVDLLDVEAALFLPSGTMAQQIALRLHTERQGLDVVALHPTSHLVRWEERAHEWLHGLRTVELGDATVPWTAADLTGLGQPVGAVGLELPLRELGGRLPGWDQVEAVREWGLQTATPVHLDGARLWEAAAGYHRTPAEVVARFDSAYVSFYKVLGAIAGAALVGDAELIEAAKPWRRRHGGALYGLWPYAASSLAGLRERLPRVGSYLEVARDVVARLADHPDIEAVPDPPQTSMAHLHLRVDGEAVGHAALAMATDKGIATFNRGWPTIRPRWCVVELTCGDATLEMGAAAVAEAIIELVERAGSQG